MDSLTQAVLGATISVAVAGPKIGARKAALAGAVFGTLPDLDVLYKHGDPVSNFVLHRGWSHSLLVHAALTPLIGEALMRLFRGLRDRRMAAYATVFLCLTTHALLDAMTIYGTRLLWPLTDTPFGVGSVFIIDPLYTLPLLGAAIWALTAGGWSERLKRVTAGALVLSTLYLGWSLAAQRIADGKAREALAAAGLDAEQVLATPMPFNTLLWRTIAVDGAVYYNIYQPVFGDAASARIHAHPRLAPESPCLDTLPHAATVAAFSKGYYRTLRDEDGLRIADLRMGVTPSFVFDFRVAAPEGEVWKEILPERIRAPRSAEGDVAWLLSAMFGDTAVRPAEAASLFDAERKVLAALPDVPSCG
ncbi:metal-dependent hydrolase [Nisaea acidiphila]|uniref:Metal-dependent hydrolase n=1 Tax=Nisaea acidiphila TaxID=1862145 RepID=A0A9J7AK08_9PROT|nr:metal-dependent hydrolase [Nisaea acidiphila]UUX48003.1 metal-dependent hydrolase [Nisaea acidiphila]